ncbi:hypothetical protein K5Q02_16440 [Pseudomonas sp. MM211]|uniref:hypothetical protein n=1 Tax=Pseudomonas sp. MM211 TaxID=2866808 RepID=UPI001CEC1BBC|nr:hypothetical protein [Pseudomonas sp. MM211]UCJ15436.1 hypothetical protein K5Q02_16440 [Pseudomonas sp. MM211]
MPTVTSKAPEFTHTSKSGTHNVQLEFIWANESGGVAQAVIATFHDDAGKPIKRLTVPGPFSESGSARKAVITRANAWFDHGQE